MQLRRLAYIGLFGSLLFINSCVNSGETSRNSQEFPFEGVIVRGFGNSPDPLTGLTAKHPGIEITAAKGTIAHAVEQGTVLKTGDEPIYGKYLILEHPNWNEDFLCSAR